MAKRGFHCELPCVLCTGWACETANHLLFECAYARSVWNRLSNRLGYRLMVLGDSIEQTWSRSKRSAMAAGIQNERGWIVCFSITMWFVWKQRNEKVFRDKVLLSMNLVDRIHKEGILWMKFCKGKLR